MKKSKTEDILATYTWERNDEYSAIVFCKNRLRVALKVLFIGKIKLAWQVPVTQKDKRLIIKGKKCHSGKP